MNIYFKYIDRKMASARGIPAGAAGRAPLYSNEDGNNGNNGNNGNGNYGNRGNSFYAISNKSNNSADEFMHAQYRLHDIRPKEIYNVRNRILRGVGSYGAVVSPAIDNIVNGKVQKFPKKVTKLLFKKNAYNKTLRNIQIIREIIPELAYNVDPYVRNIRLGNIRNEPIHRNIVERLQKKAIHTTNATPLYGVRMNDMGYDLFDIYKNTELQTHLLTHVPLVTIVKEMKKATETVQAIYNADYIHGDIRDTNVLCNVETGKLQIIDFDFLKPISTLSATDVRFLYSHPIESYIIKNEDGMLDIIQSMCKAPVINMDYLDEPSIHRVVTSQIRDHYNTAIRLLTSNGTVEIQNEVFSNIIDDYKIGILQLVDGIRTLIPDRGNDRLEECKRILNESYTQTFDTYGLGIAFLFYVIGIRRKNTLDIYDPVFNGNSEKATFYINTLQQLITIAYQMIHANFFKRYTIDRVIDELDKVIRHIEHNNQLVIRRTASAPLRRAVMAKHPSKKATRKLKKLAPVLSPIRERSSSTRGERRSNNASNSNE